MALVYQALALSRCHVLFLVVGNVREYLPRAGLALGWDFLRFPARFEIDDNIVGATARDPVWMAFLAGAANTILVSITSNHLVHDVGAAAGVGAAVVELAAVAAPL